MSINDIRLSLKTTWDMSLGSNYCRITGCVITSNDQIILADRDYKNRLLILTADGTLEKEVKFKLDAQPVDVTPVDDKSICVCFVDKRLEIIDKTTYKTTNVIKTDNPCCGVTSDGENLIWYEQYKGIQIKQKSCDIISTLVKDDSGNYWSYLTVHNNRIYQTHQGNNTVTCFKISGEKVWEFKDTSAIYYPRGITVDNDANVYIVSRGNNVVVLSPDGKTSRILLNSEDGLKNLYGIYFDKKTNILLVSNLEGQVHLYNVL